MMSLVAGQRHLTSAAPRIVPLLRTRWRPVQRINTVWSTRTAAPQRASSSKGSSKRYLVRQNRDPYVKARDEDGAGYVARSAYKLKQLDEAAASKGGRGSRARILYPGALVVDLGAAPGGWTQVCLESKCAHVFALDCLPLHRDVLGHDEAGSRLTHLQGDMRSQEMHAALRRSIVDQRAKAMSTNSDLSTHEHAHVDVVLSDMMANMSGNALRDTQAIIDLLETALVFAKRVLRPRGSVTNKTTSDAHRPEIKDDKSTALPPSTFIAKYFISPETEEFRKVMLIPAFDRVASVKVGASRKESKEMYFVCRGLRPGYATHNTDQPESP